MSPVRTLAAALLLLASHATLADLSVYPMHVANPRVPYIAPATGGATGHCMKIAAEFVYQLSPYVSFAPGATVTMALRDDPNRAAKDLVAFKDGDRSLKVSTLSASAGRFVNFTLTNKGRIERASATKTALSGKWTSATITITPTTASLKLGDADAVVIDLPEPLRPATVSLGISHVDDLKVTSDGAFALDWDHGYAAQVAPTTKIESAMVDLMGFDSYFVSAAPNRRDTPMIFVTNDMATPLKTTVRFHATSEVAQRNIDWEQTVAASARSSSETPIAFPGGLTSDVYHLRMTASLEVGAILVEKHFAYTARRSEAAGPPKFGLHDSDRDTFGFWPDALPINLAHEYARWGYIVGPVWAKDFNGTYGIDPDTDPTQWNWNALIEWPIAQGLTPYVCIGGDPMLEWMRQPGFDGAKAAVKYNWGPLGGIPDDRRYRQFIHALAEHYCGKVPFYEIQNEPNAFPPGGITPEDYVGRLKAAFEEIHAADPKAKVYGICGTGNFVPWMTKVFELGGAQYMDAISFHTYVTPKLPEEGGLPEKLDEVRALAKKYGKPLAFINSETGTYVALREDATCDIPKDRLDDLIKQGTPTLSVAHGWPSYALDETTGAVSIVRNATYNFVAGARYFTFFGWNDKWPSADWWAKTADGGFAMISMSKDGIRTPSLYTLAIGVLTAQLESADVAKAVAIADGDIHGAVFPTTSGGSTAVVWSSSGKRTVLFDVRGQGVDAVSLFGQPIALPKSNGNLKQLDLGEQPVYIHVKRGTIAEAPSPVEKVKVVTLPDGLYKIQYSLLNRAAKVWSGSVAYTAPSGWTVIPATATFAVPSNGTATLEATARQPIAARGRLTVDGSLSMPDGERFSLSFPINVRPTLSVSKAADGALTFDTMPGAASSISRPEQVAIGRPPSLVSLQEGQYWQGPAELSGAVKAAWTSTALVIAIKVHDANFRPPASWPGVGGSCVELFLDFRAPGAGLGSAQYGAGVYQVIFKPGSGNEAPDVWNPHGAISGATATGGKAADGDYLITYSIPLASVGLGSTATAQFGFDVAIDGPPAGGSSRKSQMALFGGASNSVDASGFGIAMLKP